MSTKRRYSDFARKIDVNAFEEAIGFEPMIQRDEWDQGTCPDPWGLHKHGDTTGKLGINRESRNFNCWVCGGGTLLGLVMAIHNMREDEAIDWLYQFVGEQSDTDFMDEIESILEVAKQEQVTDPWFNDHVLDKWLYQPYTLAWASEKGIHPNVIESNRVGFDQQHRRRSMSKGEEYEGPAIILPHYWQGKLVGWQERWLDESRPKWLPKYTNTRDFPRDRTIYNYEAVYFSEDPIVVVESVPTVLFLASFDIPAVATFGSNVTDEQIRLLRLCQQGLILAPDNDRAGEKWAGSLALKLSRYISIQVTYPVTGPEGADLADLKSEEYLRSHLRHTEFF